MKRLITIIVFGLAFHINMIAQCPPISAAETDVTKALALVTHYGFQFTGTVVNNNSEDETYYFLTASYPFKSECDDGTYSGSTYPDIEFRWWNNNQVTTGATLVALSGELALLELDDAPPYSTISYLGIKESNGTPYYSLNYHSTQGSFPYLGITYVDIYSTANVETQCSSLSSDSYDFTSSSPDAIKVENWTNNIKLNNNKWAKGAPLLDDQERIVGVFVTRTGNSSCSTGDDNSYFSMDGYSQIENYLGASTIRAIKIKPCTNEEVEDLLIQTARTTKASIRVIGKSKIDNVAVTFSAGTEVMLESGFDSGNNFIAEIKPCVSQITPLAKTDKESNFTLNKPKTEEAILNPIKAVSAYPTVIIDNQITLESEGLNQVEYFLTNMQGEVLLKDKYQTAVKGTEQTIGLPSLSSGIYLLYVSDGLFSKTIKLVK